jgi:hypothetical protein
MTNSQPDSELTQPLLRASFDDYIISHVIAIDAWVGRSIEMVVALGRDYSQAPTFQVYKKVGGH